MILCQLLCEYGPDHLAASEIIRCLPDVFIIPVKGDILGRGPRA